MSKAIRLLIIEDSEDDAALLLLELKRGGIEIEKHQRVETSASMQDALDIEVWDLITADHDLPSFSAPEAIKLLKHSGQDIPFIIVSGSIDEQIAVDCLKAGAHDFIVKGRWTRLVPAIARELSDAEIRHQHRQQEVMLRKLSHVVGQSPNAVSIINSNHCIEYVNAAYIDNTGFSTDDVIGKNIEHIPNSSGADICWPEIWPVISAGYNWQVKHSNNNKGGVSYTEMMSISPIRDENSDISHFAIIQQDVSEQESLEAKFHQSQKMESIGTLVGGLAHDFNNMLSGMLGNIYLAKSSARSIPKVVEKLKHAEQLGFHAGEMVAQLLAFARKGKMTMKQFSLSSFVKEAYKLAKVSISEDIKLSCDICREPLKVKGDSTLLQQVLMNLMNNARDAVAECSDPEIRIALNYFTADEQFKRLHPDLKAVEFAHLSVSDNGGGIEQANQNKVFEPFFTTKEMGKGTGLGLAMTYGAIRSHDGMIELQSEFGKGTTFHIYLPLCELGAKELDSHQEAVLKGSEETILLVDDEEELLSVAAAVLHSLNYRVIKAADGVKAIEVFQQHCDDIDLVILDVVMPNMGGMEAAQKIQQINPQIKIIFTSGYDRDNVLKQSSDSASIPILPKPFSPQSLSQIVHQQLSS